MSILEGQVGGTHYSKLKEYQPFVVLSQWMSDEAFKGYMLGNVITYLQRDKNGREDIEKASHTLQAYLEITKK